MAEIQFSKGLKEPVVPDIRLSRTKTGEKGSAKFYFEQPTILGDQQTEEITGMYLIDEEGVNPQRSKLRLFSILPQSGIVLCVLWNVTVAKTV
jgi:photosystem II reaction center protein Psb28